MSAWRREATSSAKAPASAPSRASALAPADVDAERRCRRALRAERARVALAAELPAPTLVLSFVGPLEADVDDRGIVLKVRRARA